MNALCENLQESDEKVEAIQKVVDRTKRIAEDSHAKMKICEVELKKAAALLRKEEREEGEANQRDLEGARKRDSGKSPEGHMTRAWDEL